MAADTRNETPTAADIVEQHRSQQLELRFLRSLYENARKFMHHHGVNANLAGRAFLAMEADIETLKLLDGGKMDAAELAQEFKRLHALSAS